MPLVAVVLSLALSAPSVSADGQVDVSAYPAEQQANYLVYRQKCAKCHALSLSLTNELTDAQWKRHVREMQLHPGAAISPEHGEKILSFLRFHHAQAKP